MSEQLVDNTELLSEVAHIIDPHPSHRAPEAVSEGVPFAGIGDLNVAGELLPGKGRIVPVKTLAEHALRYKLSGNTIGFGRVASIGKVIDFRVTISDLAISPTMAVIEPFAVNKDFLLAALEGVSVRKKIDQWLTGSTRSSLGIELLREIPLPKFDQHSQRTIGAVYRALVTNIEKTEALIEKYQQIKAGLMHDLFTRGIGADGKLRPPREQAPEMYKQTPIGWIPKEWQYQSITTFADVIDPNPSHRNPIYHDEGFPFISTVEFEDFDQIRLDTSRRVIEGIVLEQERRCMFSEHSIVFSRKGTIGETRKLPTHLRFALLDSLCVINPKNINSLFLFNSLRSHFLKRQIKNMTMGQALPQMSIGRVRDLLVSAPISAVEQEQIESRLCTIDRYIYTNGEELIKLKSKKSGLMHDLLNGNVQVNVDQAEAVNV